MNKKRIEYNIHKQIRIHIQRLQMQKDQARTGGRQRTRQCEECGRDGEKFHLLAYAIKRERERERERKRMRKRAAK